MIQTQDRSGYFGASDTVKITGNWETATFKKWWLEKIGIRRNDFSNKSMKVGTAFEHKILDALDVPVRKDHQIILPEIRLRVNYDGDFEGTIYEVKTHLKAFKVNKAYEEQAQVEMFAMKSESLYIVAYQLTENDYKNYFADIDKARLSYHEIEYDSAWIDSVYLPKVKHLCMCLNEGKMPASGGLMNE